MIGDLRERITLYNPALVSDGQGGFTESWSEVDTVWASIEPLTANQVFFSQQLQHRVTHKVTIRYTTALAMASNMKIVHGTRTFYLKTYRLVSERNQFYEIMAEEGAGVNS